MAEPAALPVLTRRPLVIEDLLAHRPRAEQAAEHAAALAALDDNGLDLIGRLGRAWCWRWGSEPVALGGLIRLSPQRMAGWALVDRRARPEALRALIRTTRKTLKAMSAFDAIQISVHDGFAAGARTAEALGFRATDRHLPANHAMPGQYRIWEHCS
jgi:hypothetical protein